MGAVRCRGVTVLAVWALMVALVSAQITFSRDWTGGKRSPHLALDCGQFTRLCRHFVHELKQVMSSEVSVKHHRPDGDEASPTYDDEK